MRHGDEARRRYRTLHDIGQLSREYRGVLSNFGCVVVRGERRLLRAPAREAGGRDVAALAQPARRVDRVDGDHGRDMVRVPSNGGESVPGVRDDQPRAGTEGAPPRHGRGPPGVRGVRRLRPRVRNGEAKAGVRKEVVAPGTARASRRKPGRGDDRLRAGAAGGTVAGSRGASPGTETSGEGSAWGGEGTGSAGGGSAGRGMLRRELLERATPCCFWRCGTMISCDDR